MRSVLSCVLALAFFLPAAAAHAHTGPWTAAALATAVDNDQEVPIATGWLPGKKTYAVCKAVCVGRSERQVTRCFSAKADRAGRVKSLRSLSPKRFAKQGFAAAPAAAVTKVGRYALSVEAKEDWVEPGVRAVCTWKVFAQEGDRKALLLEGKKDCFQEPTVSLELSPEGDALGVTVWFEERHNCGAVVGHVLAIPEALERALPPLHLTAQTLRKKVGGIDAPRSVAGWSAKDGSFGSCGFASKTGRSAYELTCRSGSPAAAGAVDKLPRVKKGDWLAKEFVPAKGLKKLTLGATNVAISVRSDGVFCKWSVTATKGASKHMLAEGKAECHETKKGRLYLSPDGRAVGVTFDAIGTHFNGTSDAFVVSVAAIDKALAP